jgi:catechol 2,3-dioxygenase-like lactoylglutathione lyase family enzyme
MQGAITDLFAGVPVSDLDASIDWYTRFFGRPPDTRVGEEVLWEIDERGTLFIEPNAARAGAGRITFAVAGLDALLEGLAPAPRRRLAVRRKRLRLWLDRPQSAAPAWLPARPP